MSKPQHIGPILDGIMAPLHAKHAVGRARGAALGRLADELVALADDARAAQRLAEAGTSPVGAVETLAGRLAAASGTAAAIGRTM